MNWEDSPFHNSRFTILGERVTYGVVLFDLDGTLTDPIEGITKSVQYALERYGIRENIGTLVPFVGPPLMGSFMTFYGFDEVRAREAVSYYREYFERQGMYENRVFDGIPHLLRRLRESGVTAYVVTSKPTFYAKQIVEHFGLEAYLAGVVGSEMDLTNTDKPTLVRMAIGLNPGVEKGRFVMVGDTEHDIIGARANGIDSIGVTYGAGSREEVEGAGPTHVAHTVEELGMLLLG